MTDQTFSGRDNVNGGSADETVFATFNPGEFHLGAGDDTVWFEARNIRNFDIVHHGETTVVFDNENAWLMTGVETIKFIDAEINVAFEKARLRAESSNPLHSFIETEIAEAYTYAGEFNEAQLVVSFSNIGIAFDINSDGFDDAIIPIQRGYKSGADTREHFQVFEGGPDGLRYSEALTNQQPFIPGARRIEEIEIASVGKTALVTVGTDTTRENESSFDIPWRMGDLTVILPSPDLNIADQIVPDVGFGKLPALTGRKAAVDAHGMAVGDYDNDGLEDILIGDSTGPFVLRQTLSGPWEVINSPFLDGFHKGVFDPISGRADGGFLLDLHMEDLNGDGADDIVAGWGDLRTASRVYLNDGRGGFSEDGRIELPQSDYGENTLHLETFSEDFDRDGDQDLVILHSQNEPYYSGTYLQFLQNDGAGNFIDQTAARFGQAFPDGARRPGERGVTSDWEVGDLNGDGALDLLGEDIENSKNIIALINDGQGRFDRHDVPIPSEDGGSIIVAGDFDNDGKFEFVSFRTIPREDGLSSVNTFFLHELSTSDFSSTGTSDDASVGSTMIGDGGNGKMSGSKRDDLMLAFGGDDTLRGKGGDDTLMGFDGDDVLLGGGGADSLDGDKGADLLKGGGGGDDMNGGGGGDEIRGGGGNDAALGGGGGDLLRGDGGDDILHGGGGKDLIIGGKGKDTLTGGGGKDTFQFKKGDKKDVITGFQDGKDKIEVIGVRDFDQIRISQRGDDAHIKALNLKILLEDFDADNLSASDFIFS